MPARPKVLARRLAAQSRLFRIEQLDLEFANGARRTYERLLGGPDSVMIVALRDPRTVLLIREYAAGTERYELGLPKGVVEPGEDPLTAADRELQEEVGYGARELQIIQRVSLVPGYIQHHTLVVLARDLYPRRAVGDEPEPIEVVPWRLDALDELLVQPDFGEARTIAGLFLARRFLDREATLASTEAGDPWPSPRST
ncbi:ADP compounds hydrolase NudE [Thiococcus pfennigii]|jgi:ADP-ribose diphosphatase|uniref:ADP compounds hydrolase NudE n=1 Tax=Thiococcus pfennigii TaxID=1057 RepID=UPI0019037F4F|nr:ADP compounds hydrolase NudE [Thiococcus pfennigii]MBK1701562.1 ADP compounds hydrolase NudE [Thiococcus pfennigii]MBK1733098.1 ADP compounds hydrolase NudE [Thiococcus pfennigii]